MSQAAPSNIVQLARLRRIAQENPSQQPKPKILFVDDEERILNSLRALFRLQYDVTVTTDGFHALELLKRDHYHLLVSDQRMPIMQGVELLRRSREVSPNTVRILLTGFSDLAAIVGSVNEGEVYRYINKPWDTEELQDIIGSAVTIGLDLEKLKPLPPPESPDETEDTVHTTDTTQAEPAESTDTDEDKEPPKTAIIKDFPTPTTNKPGRQPEQQKRKTTGKVLEKMELEGTLLFIDHDGQLATTFEECNLEKCQTLAAHSPEEALQLMQQHEVSVIVASIDGVNQANIGFLCLLKKEHPHVIAMAVARHGDSETVINLVNSARIFRVIFYPLRASVLRHHLIAAFRQADNFRSQPVLVKVQQAEEIEPTSNVMSGIGKLLKTRMKSIRSFFGKGAD